MVYGRILVGIRAYSRPGRGWYTGVYYPLLYGRILGLGRLPLSKEGAENGPGWRQAGRSETALGDGPGTALLRPWCVPGVPPGVVYGCIGPPGPGMVYGCIPNVYYVYLE